MKQIKALFFDLGDTLIREYHKGEPVPEEPVVFPHVKDVIHRLAKKFTLAIISNTGREGSLELKMRLKKAELDTYFALILASAEEGIRKPHIEIFNRALARLDLTAPEVIMIGNRISKDILGGNRAGMQSILIWHIGGIDHHPDDKNANTEEERPIATVNSFLDLEKVLLQITNKSV